ncbi:hypothetical protein SNOG_06162 [Parastagonospora nodorum SN15]|uniref:Uncharacterized protein n=1 Tax=Phaeosphaeria nodorum (strain SN15 / ATCC MYA-4574 / FGSC 10173) TaxID=321614 RepID=Q0UQ02_PHANO|nr:hypothetical protein SNOG_06162 [Parastagonospora nodorum SN15]EAT85993.1 hypothetical protein SNOG_06162 [Parastagonospora nodorum SN15]
MQRLFAFCSPDFGCDRRARSTYVLAAAMEQPRSSDQRRLQDELRRGI